METFTSSYFASHNKITFKGGILSNSFALKYEHLLSAINDKNYPCLVFLKESNNWVIMTKHMSNAEKATIKCIIPTGRCITGITLLSCKAIRPTTVACQTINTKRNREIKQVTMSMIFCARGENFETRKSTVTCDLAACVWAHPKTTIHISKILPISTVPSIGALKRYLSMTSMVPINIRRKSKDIPNAMNAFLVPLRPFSIPENMEVSNFKFYLK
jgi:hypothetical protein